MASLAAGLLLALVVGLVGVTWQWRQAVANLAAAEAANRKAQARFDLAMEAVQAFTTGASEDVILGEAAGGPAEEAAGGSLTFYDRLAASLEGETDRASRRSLAEAVFDAAELNGRIGGRRRRWRRIARRSRLREALAREAPGDVEARRELGRSELAVGETLAAMGRHAEARQAFARARAIAEAGSPVGPTTPTRVLARRRLSPPRALAVRRAPARRGPAVPGAGEEIYDRLIRDGRHGRTRQRAVPPRAGEVVPSSWVMVGYQYGRWPRPWPRLEQAIADYEELTRRFPGDIDLWLALANCHGIWPIAIVIQRRHPLARRAAARPTGQGDLRAARPRNPTVTSIRVRVGLVPQW